MQVCTDSMLNILALGCYTKYHENNLLAIRFQRPFQWSYRYVTDFATLITKHFRYLKKKYSGTHLSLGCMDTAYVGEHPPHKIAGYKVQYLRFSYLKFLVTELTFWRRRVGWKTLRTSSFCVSQQLQVARIAEVGAESERWEGGGDSWFHWFWVSCDPWHISIDLNDISVYIS